jgi:hypothetical protein
VGLIRSIDLIANQACQAEEDSVRLRHNIHLARCEIINSANYSEATLFH